MSLELIETAARSHPRSSRRGLLESLFARLFSSFVYPQIWEDPRVDLEALELQPGARLATIASGGCNVMSYLLARPGRIIAVDLVPAHLALTAENPGDPAAVRQRWRRLDRASAALFAKDRSAVYGGFHVYARAVH